MMTKNAFLQDELLMTIESAIRSQRVIQIKFHSVWRTLEPYQLGYSIEGEKALTVYGYCRDIVSDAFTPSRWQLFHLKEIEQIDLTTYCFEPHLSYMDQAELIQPIFCQLSLLRKSVY